MILDTDFLDHWKTRQFIDMIGHEHATHYILRLWFHCQTRRTVTFENMTSRQLKAICKFDGDADVLLNAFVESGFVVGYPTGIRIPKWAEANKGLIANWDNGNKGGRPSKKPQKEAENDEIETQQKPIDNPKQYRGNPSITVRKEGREVSKVREGEGEPHREENPYVKPPRENVFVNPIARFSESVQTEARAAHDDWHFWKTGSTPNLHNESVHKDLNHFAAAAEAKPGTLIAKIKSFISNPPAGWPRNAPVFKVLKQLGYDAEVKLSVTSQSTVAYKSPEQIRFDARLAKQKESNAQ